MPTETAFSHTPNASHQAPALVLVHFGDAAPTLRCLESLVQYENHPHRVIVVDHSAVPGLQGRLSDIHPAVTVLVDATNPGFAAGCNRGAKHAFETGAGSVWFLNNDAQVEGPLLEQLGTLAETHPTIALWGTHQQDGGDRIGADHQNPWFAAGLQPFSAPAGMRCLAPQETLSGASIFLTRAAWDRLGPWPEDCFLYWEDAAWCRRAHALGLGLALLDAAVIHPRGTTTGRRSPLTTFYGVRNMLNLHRACLPHARSERFRMALHLLQKRLFQGRWGMLKPTWDGIRAAFGTQVGRDPRY